ncbi:MAG: DoxX family protein [Microscillaceae bacterium]|nr:DoxX family protein [Microscillaceae bacterium]
MLKIIFWVITGLLSALMLMSAGMYFFRYPEVVKAFTALGYPAYLIYPLATAKILGVVALLTRASVWLKEWAYAGFFFDFALAATAHTVALDGGLVTSLVAIGLLLASYVLDKMVFGTLKQA